MGKHHRTTILEELNSVTFVLMRSLAKPVHKISQRQVLRKPDSFGVSPNFPALWWKGAQETYGSRARETVIETGLTTSKLLQLNMVVDYELTCRAYACKRTTFNQRIAKPELKLFKTSITKHLELSQTVKYCEMPQIYFTCCFFTEDYFCTMGSSRFWGLIFQCRR